MTQQGKHQAVLFTLLTISAAAAWRPLSTTFALAWHNDEYTYLMFILPVSTAMIVLERHLLVSECDWNFRVGPAMLVLAFAVFCSRLFWSSSLSSDLRLSIDMFALVLSWIGIFALCYGTGAFRSVLFPVLLVFALVPLPDVALGWFVSLLQQGSAWSTHVLFTIFGVPVLQEGNSLTIPGLTILVTRECSSIRSSSMLVLSAMVLAYVLLRSQWKRALVVALAIPISIAKNGLRIFIIAMLGARVDPGYLTGNLHRRGGILYFLLALLAVFAILWFLRRGENASIRRETKSLTEIPSVAELPIIHR